jgi:beta-galactosidase
MYISDGSDGGLDVNAEFTRRTGIQVNYSTYESNEALYSKLKTGGASYDVIIPSDYMVAKLIEEGLVQKINFGNVENFQYDQLLLSYYKPFYDMGVAVDFVKPDEDLKGYSLVLAPALLMLNENEKNNLEAYVSNGGKLLITFRSGMKDTYNNMLMDTVPGTLKELAGVEVYDYDPQFEKQTKVSAVFGEGTANLWCDIVTPITANSLGMYIGDFYAGQSCFTVNQFGRGEAYYLGCDLEEAAMDKLVRYLGRKADIALNLYGIAGVETVEATDGTKNALFLLNHNAYPVIAALDRNYTEMISGQPVKETITIQPYGVAILN